MCFVDRSIISNGIRWSLQNSHKQLLVPFDSDEPTSISREKIVKFFARANWYSAETEVNEMMKKQFARSIFSVKSSGGHKPCAHRTWKFFFFHIDNNQNGTYVVPCRIPLEPWISLSRPAWEYGSDFISWQAFSNRSAAFSITPKDLGISFFNLESWDEVMVSLPTRIRLVTALGLNRIIFFNQIGSNLSKSKIDQNRSKSIKIDQNRWNWIKLDFSPCWQLEPASPDPA